MSQNLLLEYFNFGSSFEKHLYMTIISKFQLYLKIIIDFFSMLICYHKPQAIHHSCTPWIKNIILAPKGDELATICYANLLICY